MPRWIWKTEKTSQGETDAKNVQSNPQTKPDIISKISNFVAGTSHLLIAVIMISATVGLLGIITMVSVCIATGRGPICIASKETADNSKQLEAIALTWSSWTQCSVTCGEGSQIRYKLTDDGNATEHQNQSCKLEICTYGTWQPWSEWSFCSVTCGSGIEIRTRDRPCSVSEQCIHREVDTEEQSRECSKEQCPVNGGWSDWGQWAACSPTCGLRYRSRKRLCNNPAPMHGGKNCDSSSTETDLCRSVVPCPVDGGLGPWRRCRSHLGISKCFTRPIGQCKAGKLETCRYCDNPRPAYGGKGCQGLAFKLTDCWNTEDCDNSILQPPMNFSVEPSDNRQELIVSWRRAPFGLPAESFLVQSNFLFRVLPSSKAVVPIVPRSQQNVLGEKYQHRFKYKPHIICTIYIETRSSAGGMTVTSKKLDRSVRF